jgi:hypothetical protein
MNIKDKLIEKMEWIGQELAKYWYVDMTIAMVGVIIYLLAQRLKKKDKV